MQGESWIEGEEIVKEKKWMINGRWEVIRSNVRKRKMVVATARPLYILQGQGSFLGATSYGNRL